MTQAITTSIRIALAQLNPLVGDTFVTMKRQPILTLVEDTSPGVHDTFMAACDRHRYERLGVKAYHRNCLDNMFEGMRELGLEPPMPILASFNVFMNIAVEPDGRSLNTGPAVTKPGDYITLRADMDCYVAFSACPQDIVKIQGEAGVPQSAHFIVLDQGFGAWSYNRQIPAKHDFGASPADQARAISTKNIMLSSRGVGGTYIVVSPG